MKTENRQKVLVIAAFAVVVLYLGNMLVYEPAKNWYLGRVKEIQDLTLQVQKGRTTLANEAATRSRWRQMTSNVLPDNSAVAEHKLIGAINNWAQDSSVDVTGILPQWKNDTDDYKTLNCRIEVAGAMGPLSRFLYDIEQGPMALKVESIELSARDAGGQQLTLGVQVSGLALVDTAANKLPLSTPKL
jgi:Tfp pilus assembly protein PilO